MADLEVIVENPRTGLDDDPEHKEEGSVRENGSKRKRSRKRRGSDGSEDLARTVGSGHIVGEEPKRENVPRRADNQGRGATPTQENHRAKFYEKYRKQAEDYDKEFLKKYDEDLNTTLIFAGLFSAVTSTFIVEVDSQLKLDTGDETAALLRVLIHKIDNTTFGNSPPALPQWTGPPRMIVEVQAILFASLAVSLLSAFLAMLGKQWLNRYQSTEMRGTVIERSQNRQRKLDGITAWYFDYVMESLPLMLQASLLLLGCALSRYLWEVNETIATVVLGVTSFGVLFYVFIVIAGTISEDCPYQTPGAHIFRHILINHILHTFRSIKLVGFIRKSYCYRVPTELWPITRPPWYSVENITNTLSYSLLWMFVAPVVDVYRLGRTAFRSLIAVSKIMHHQWMVPLYRTTYRWSVGAFSPQTHGPGQQTITLDLRCVSWILQTSLDKVDHLSAFNHLWSMPELGKFDPILVVDCFNGLNSCIGFSNGKVVVMQRLEQLAEMAARGFCRTLYHLTAMDPMSGVLTDLRRRYNKIFPPSTDFSSIPFRSVMILIHALAGQPGNPKNIKWNEQQLSSEEHIPFARCMVEAAQAGYQRTQGGKVPRWILRFALDSLSRGTPSLTSVVASCLSIIAIDLGCDVSDIVTPDEGYVLP